MTAEVPDALDGHAASRVAAHGAALRLLSYGASLTISIIAIRMLTMHLGTGFGTYTVVSSIAFVAVGSTDAGLASFALREGANVSRTARSDLLANILGLRIVLLILGIMAGVLFTLLTGRTPSFIFGVAAVSAGLALATLQQAVTIHLQLDLRNGVVASLELVKTVALTATYGIFVLFGAGLTVFYLAPAIAGFAMLAATTLVVPLALFRPSFHSKSWSRVLRAVLPYALAAAVTVLYFRVTQITMGYIATPEQINEYALAFRVVEVLTVIPVLVAISALPLIARARTSGPDRLRPLARSLGQTALLAGLALATATAAGAPIAIRVIGGGANSGSVAVLQVLAVALAFTFPLALWSYLLLAVEEVRALSICGSVAAASALALALALVPDFGAMGGAVATIVAEGILAIGLLLAILRFDREFIPRFSRLARLLLAVLPAAAIVWLTRDAGLLLPLTAVPAFALAAVTLRAVPPEIWDLARLSRA
ncbi:MAG TPA: polysaccharide biosynthesis C-terminal domain-containing protein [Gemmatimonadaceae bacterium]